MSTYEAFYHSLIRFIPSHIKEIQLERQYLCLNLLGDKVFFSEVWEGLFFPTLVAYRALRTACQQIESGVRVILSGDETACISCVGVMFQESVSMFIGHILVCAPFMGH